MMLVGIYNLKYIYTHIKPELLGYIAMLENMRNCLTWKMTNFAKRFRANANIMEIKEFVGMLYKQTQRNILIFVNVWSFQIR